MLRIDRQLKRNFVLYEGDRELGRLIYPKWWSSKAEILLPEGIYMLSKAGFWSTDLVATFQDIPIIKVNYSWKGGGTLKRPGHPERTLKYALQSIWKSIYVVTDVQGRERLVTRTKMTWSHMDRDHEIEKVGEPPLEPLEILMLVHAINVSNRRAAAVAAS